MPKILFNTKKIILVVLYDEKSLFTKLCPFLIWPPQQPQVNVLTEKKSWRRYKCDKVLEDLSLNKGAVSIWTGLPINFVACLWQSRLAVLLAEGSELLIEIRTEQCIGKCPTQWLSMSFAYLYVSVYVDMFISLSFCRSSYVATLCPSKWIKMNKLT